MRYYGLSVLAVAVFGVSVYVFCNEITSLLEVGTCASGGPYVPARPCPDEVTGSFWLLMGSIFGLFAAAGIAGLRGGRPGGGGFGFGSMMVTGWALFFTISGAVSLIHSQTSDTIPDDGKLGGTIVGITFLVMGVPALLGIPLMIKNARDTARGRGSPETVYANNIPGGTGWLAALKTGSKLMKDMSTQMSSSGSVGSSDSVGSTGSSSSSFGSASSSSASPFGVAQDASSGDAELAELDTLEKLERLQKLREAGALTESEFEAQKARILSSSR